MYFILLFFIHVKLVSVIKTFFSVLGAPKEISDWCVMCKSLVPNCDDKIVSNDTCPSCGLDKLQSDRLQKEYNEVKF